MKTRIEIVLEEAFGPTDKEIENAVMNYALQDIFRRMQDKEYDSKQAKRFRGLEEKEIFAILQREMEWGYKP